MGQGKTAMVIVSLTAAPRGYVGVPGIWLLTLVQGTYSRFFGLELAFIHIQTSVCFCDSLAVPLGKMAW